MDTLEYRGHVNRTGWGAGEWDNEPDKAQWPDPATGLPCLAVRHDAGGHWCGYVGVPPGHPMYDQNGEQLLTHGGVTFMGPCAPDANEATDVCHVPGPGEEPNVWWLGFDCAHGFDVCPGYAALYKTLKVPALFKRSGATYRTLSYVKDQCAQLAQQLATMTK